jgi:hypothetical protein
MGWTTKCPRCGELLSAQTSFLHVCEDAAVIMYEYKRLRTFAKWVVQQRWNENADIDEICTRAEKALNPAPARHEGT